jgi:hypothetical protein
MTTPIVAPAIDCRALVPASVRPHVKSAPIPQGHLKVGDIMKFADAQTGQLSVANTRGDLALAVIDTCSQANADAAKRLAPRKWWHFW